MVVPVGTTGVNRLNLPPSSLHQFSFWLRQGAQGVTMSVRLWGTKCSKALNLYLSLIGLSQVGLRSVRGRSEVSLSSVYRHTTFSDYM